MIVGQTRPGTKPGRLVKMCVSGDLFCLLRESAWRMWWQNIFFLYNRFGGLAVHALHAINRVTVPLMYVTWVPWHLADPLQQSWPTCSWKPLARTLLWKRSRL
jgi:hypothetical protein